jgi:hypothetical protein
MICHKTCTIAQALESFAGTHRDKLNWRTLREQVASTVSLKLGENFARKLRARVTFIAIDIGQESYWHSIVVNVSLHSLLHSHKFSDNLRVPRYVWPTKITRISREK